MTDCGTCTSWQETTKHIGWCKLLGKFTVRGVDHSVDKDCKHVEQEEESARQQEA